MSDKVKIVFLGTGATMPTKNRALSSICIRFEGEWLLFDCPEGTQRQMMKAKTSYLKIKNIFDEILEDLEVYAEGLEPEDLRGSGE